MTKARWLRIQDLYHAAREHPPSGRAAFLLQACDGDLTLVDEVQSLLDQPISAERFLASRETDANDNRSSVQIGQRLGIYQFQAFIGRGGMGEVYLARDTKLDRDVAIKILPSIFTSDPERLARFEREARVLASLNHPHIGAIYGLEEGDGVRGLVLELVPGETLADRVARGLIPLPEALAIASQIVEALEAAHAKGIVHRDLKPANVKITPEGVVKVLDFGLAKLDASGSSLHLTETPTDPVGRTRDGMILGTEGYMSPEQARGHSVDKRTDVWAFGCVLFEMLTGRTAFQGGTVSDTLVAILEREPDWTALPAATPQSILRLLRRCLQKNKNARAPDIGLARLEIEDALAAPDIGVTIPKSAGRSVWSHGRLWAFAAALGAAAFTSLWIWRPSRAVLAPNPLVARLSITPPDRNRFDIKSPPAVSPDGRYIVFAATSDEEKHQLWLRRLDSLAAEPLAGTENGIFPFWSPDSKAIGFFAAGKLKRMNVSGGPAIPLADASQGRGGTWSQDGTIIFAPTIYSGLFQVAAAGGDVRRATHFEEGTPPQKFPWFLPDGRHFLYLFGAGGRDQQMIRVGSLDSPSEDRALLTGADTGAMYAEGYLLFTREATLVARRFDAASLAFIGEEVAVADHLLTKGPPNQSWVFSVSANGVLTYETGGPSATQLTWLDRTGKRLSAVGDPNDLDFVTVAPDGTAAAVTVEDASSLGQQIWIYDLTRGLPTRFTNGPAPHIDPVWSPDGRVLVFGSNRRGRYDLYRKPADGSRNEELLYADDHLKNPASFSPNGSFLAYWVFGDLKTGDDIWILPSPLTAPPFSKPYPFMQTEFNEQTPQFSPDGRWIAYRSNESGRYEVYVAPFAARGGKVQVSTSGGSMPRWRPSGKELFYVGSDNRLVAAEVNTNGATLEVKKLGTLFGPVFGSYDISLDGLRFLTVSPIAGVTNPPLAVVQNWVAAIKN